jgi:predicted DsbA family dithiol-disulfide isomerase/uncharacterized membrane protein
MNKKSLYNNASFNYQLLFGLASLVMIGVGIYLTNHYFEVLYPTGLGGSFCNISTFLNCDITSLSKISNVFGVPISVFGMMLGVFFLLGFLLPKNNLESTNHFLALINFIGCIVLFLFSLIVLKGLCPMCFVYYLASGVALFCFYKTSENKKPFIKVLAAYLILTSVPAGGTWYVLNEREEKKVQLKQALITEYNRLNNLGDPEKPSPFKIEMSTPNFSDAPVRLTIFSDFQCPMCKRMAELGEELIKKYKGKINVQYVFFPLDNSCNPAMDRSFHPFACKAAYLAACAPNEFAQIHGYIFQNQEILSTEFLEKTAKKFNVEECYKKEASKALVKETIEISKKYNIASTPTNILNGRKIEGALPIETWEILIDDLLK